MTSPAGRALAHVRDRSAAGRVPAAPITVSFHPDRLLADGLSVAEHLAAERRYRSQFETRISNGGLTAHPGGDRDLWEHRMFGSAYAGVVVDRPIYGGLNLAHHIDGASPRFGSCYLELAPPVLARATFSHGDSATEPTVVGTADHFRTVWEALLEQVARSGAALGVRAGSPASWTAALTAPRAAAGRALDDYVEAQIHGGLDLSGDVTAVVADPSFIGTRTAELLASLSADLRWHPGFVLAPAQFPAELRGPVAAELARYLARRYRTDRIDAALLGRAARDPDVRHAYDDALQQLKYLWHILVRLGHAQGEIA